MHLIVPDVLAEARGLSVGVCASCVAVGLLLWLFGWRWHRVWVVAAITVTGGLYGLTSEPTVGAYVFALALLLAASAGLLARELTRLLAFAGGGTAAWIATAAVFPSTPATAVVFLAGGLTAVVFHRLWTMAATSVAGTLLFGHAALVLAGELTVFDPADCAGRNPIGLSVAVGLVSLFGLSVQGALARRPSDRQVEPARKNRPRAVAADGDELPPDLQALRDEFRRKAGR